MKYKLLKGSDAFSVTLLIHGFTRFLSCHFFSIVVQYGISVVLGIPTTGMRITLNDKTSTY